MHRHVHSAQFCRALLPCTVYFLPPTIMQSAQSAHSTHNTHNPTGPTRQASGGQRRRSATGVTNNTRARNETVPWYSSTMVHDPMHSVPSLRGQPHRRPVSFLRSVHRVESISLPALLQLLLWRHSSPTHAESRGGPVRPGHNGRLRWKGRRASGAWNSSRGWRRKRCHRWRRGYRRGGGGRGSSHAGVVRPHGHCEDG